MSAMDYRVKLGTLHSSQNMRVPHADLPMESAFAFIEVRCEQPEGLVIPDNV